MNPAQGRIDSRPLPPGESPWLGIPALRRGSLRLLHTLRSPFLRPRRFHAFGVGMARSGTHSLAAMFRPNYRVAHEPEEYAVVRCILGLDEGTVSQAQLERYLIAADRRLKLELNVSLLNYFMVHSLLKLFDEARFILTVRPPIEWLESMINRQLRGSIPHRWQRLRDLRFSRPGGFPTRERALQTRGLYTLDGYLGYWARHNRDILRAVPGERLLIVETRRLAESADRMARFVGVPVDSLATRHAHSFRGKQSFDVLSHIDRAYLRETAERLCGEVASDCGVGLGALAAAGDAADG